MKSKAYLSLTTAVLLFISSLSSYAAPVPTSKQAFYDLFGKRNYIIKDGKFKTANDELTRYWQGTEFELQGTQYLTKFFVTQELEGSDEPVSYHAATVAVSAVTYQKLNDETWQLSSTQKNVAHTGSWGEVQDDPPEASFLSLQTYALLFDAGYTAQGVTESGKKLIVFNNGQWRDAGFVMTGSGGENWEGENFAYDGLIQSTGEDSNDDFPDLLVIKKGTDYSLKPVKNSLYRFDGQAYEHHSDFN